MFKILGLVGAIALGWTASASAATITFEEPGLTAMGNSPGLLVPVGARLSDQFELSDGVAFSSGGGFVAVVDHSPSPTATPSPPNVIGGTTADGRLDYRAPITAAFFAPSGGGGGVTDFVKVLGDFLAGGGTVTLQAFDPLGVLLGSVTDTDNHPAGHGPVLSFSHANIHSVVITETSGTVGFDNFQFDTPTAVAAAGVPEPAGWAMMVAGFGLLGAGLRRPRTGRAQAAA